MGNTFPTMMAALEPCHVAFEVGRGAASGVRLSGFAGRLELSDLCRRFGISRKIGYKWLRRGEEQGACLSDRSRRLDRVEADGGGSRDQDRLASGRASGLGGAQTASPVERRRRGGFAGALDDHRDSAAQRLPRCGRGGQAQAFIRFEHPRPNGLWQMDFKGHVECGWGALPSFDGAGRPFSFRPVHRGCANEQTQTVQDRLTETFQRYGLPERMTMDNGCPGATAPTAAASRR